jgi:hypothetical protein
MADDGIESGGVSDSVLRQQVQQRASEVQLLMQKNNKQGALLKAIENPPVGTRDQSIKVSRGVVEPLATGRGCLCASVRLLCAGSLPT